MCLTAAMLLSNHLLGVAPYGNLSEVEHWKEEQIGIVHRKLGKAVDWLAHEKRVRRAEKKLSEVMEWPS